MDLNILQFHFYKNFRVEPIDKDKITISITKVDALGETDDKTSKEIETRLPLKLSKTITGKVINFNLNGMIINTDLDLERNNFIKIDFKMNKLFSKWDFSIYGIIVSSFSSSDQLQGTNFGVKLQENLELKYFIKEYINKLNLKRLKESLNIAIDSKKINTKKEGLELFSLMLQMYGEIANELTTKNSLEGLHDILQIGSKIFKNSQATIYRINTDTNQLEPFASSEKLDEMMAQNYHKGIPGVVFTSGNLINIEFNEHKNPFIFEESNCYAVLATPIQNNDNKIIGVLEFKQTQKSKRFTFEDELQLKVFNNFVSLYFKNYLPQSKTSTLNSFNPNALRTNGYLGLSREAQHINKVTNKLKNVQDNILIIGETGTGKSYLSKYLHEEGYLFNHDMFNIDCEQMISAKQIEDELLKCKLDEKGSIILSNINCLEIELQKILLERLIRSNKKIISTSSVDINGLVEDNIFLKELFTLLSTCYIHLKPLRNRRQDIVSIAHFFLYRECLKRDIPVKDITPEAKKVLLNYNWPGNLKELKREIIKFLMKSPQDEFRLEIDLKNHIKETDHQVMKCYRQLVRHTDTSIPFNQLSKMVSKLLNELADGEIKEDYDDEIPKAA